MKEHPNTKQFEQAPAREPLKTVESPDAMMRSEEDALAAAYRKLPRSKNMGERSLSLRLMSAALLSTAIAWGNAREISSKEKTEEPPTHEDILASEERRELTPEEIVLRVKEFQHLVEEQGVRQKLEKLRKQFADIPAFSKVFLTYNHPEITRDLELLENAMKKPSLYAEKAANAYRERWIPRPFSPKPLVIEGFHKGTLTNEWIAKTLSEIYPEAFLKNREFHIRFVDRDGAGFGSAASTRDVGEYLQTNIFLTPAEGRREISGKDMEEREWTVYLIQHEIGHVNDWEKNAMLTPAERITFLFEVAERFEQPGHFVGVNERLVRETADPRYSVYDFVREYWADSVREFFKNHEAFERDHPHDYVLAKKWIERMSREAPER